MAHEFEGEPGMLGASQAAVLLLPTRREVRTTYGLQLAHEEFRRASNLRQHLRGHDGLPESARAASTDARFLESLSGPLERAAAALDERKARRSFPDTELVEAAAGLVHAHGPRRPAASARSGDGVAVLRRALTVAVRWGLIATNPALMVDAPSITRSQIVPYTVAEARTLLETASRDRLEARWLIALTLGLRQGEVLGLGWQHVDTERRLLTVERALQKQPDGRLALVPTKSQRSNRRLPMTESVTAALDRRRVLQLIEQEMAGSMWQHSDLIFTTAIGTPIHPRNDYRAFRHLVDKADLRPVRLHDLRHTAASLLLAEGVAARVVMEILGHSQISITLNTYTHVDPELNRDAAERLERLLHQATEEEGSTNGSTPEDRANHEGRSQPG